MSQTSEQRIADLERQLADSKKETLKVKMGNKQNVCVYELGQRFPITLYANGWVKLINNIQDVKNFIKDNHTSLSWGDNEDPFLNGNPFND